jgi:hypothetical protein
MKISDLIETTTRWIYSGRRYRLYETTFLGVFTGQGKTKDEAEQAALQAAKDAGDSLDKRKYFYNPTGKTVFVVYFEGSWCYSIINPERVANGHTHPACCSIESFEAACRMAASHAKDYED